MEERRYHLVRERLTIFTLFNLAVVYFRKLIWDISRELRLFYQNSDMAYNMKRSRSPHHQFGVRSNSPHHMMVTADSTEELDSLLRQTIGGRPGGLGILVTVLFIMAESSGSGMAALPLMVEYTGPIGYLLLLVAGLTAAYTGILLSKCWLICERRYPELLKHTSDPYATIGHKAAGMVGRVSVLVTNNVAVFGSCVVFILLSSGLISDLTTNLAPNKVSTCTLVLIIGMCLIPLSWLGTPVDFWPMSYVAALTTIVSSILIALNLGKIYWAKQAPQIVEHHPVKLKSFLLALGTIIYAFCGHMSYPTIQQDMRRRKDFWKSVSIAFTIILLMYYLVTVTSRYVLGKAVNDNVLTTLGVVSPGVMAYSAQILIVCHLLSAYLILFNPLGQDLEKFFNIQNKFSLGRVLVRTAVMLVIVFVALSVPAFNAVMSLVGASVLSLITFILPVLFYECLCRRKGDWPKIHIPLHVSIFHAEIVLVAALVAVSGTIASLDTILAPDTFVPPCYFNMTAADAVS